MLKKLINKLFSFNSVKFNKADLKTSSFKFSEIQILPMDDKILLTDDIRKIVNFVFKNNKLLEYFKGYNKYFIFVSNQASSLNSVQDIYKKYSDCASLKVFDCLPNQNCSKKCIPNLLYVRLECVENYNFSYRSGGWGFKGYILHLLIDSSNSLIWDAQGKDVN